MLSERMLKTMIERAINHEMLVLLEAFDEVDMQRAKTIFSNLALTAQTFPVPTYDQ